MAYIASKARRRTTQFLVVGCLCSGLVPGQTVSTGGPLGVTDKDSRGREYLIVYDCTVGSTCKQLGPDGAVASVKGFLFFSIFSTGIDLSSHHEVVLKIGGIEIPGALNALVGGGRNTQRLNFLVDAEKYKSLPPITPQNINVWVDGKLITVRRVDR